MSSINDQANEHFVLSEELEACIEVMREVAEENKRKHARYHNLIESSDLTAEEMIQANKLRIEINKELEELHALRKRQAAIFERMQELSRSLDAVGF